MNVTASNLRYLEEYALVMSVYDSDDKVTIPKNEPKQEDIENMARRHLCCQGITALAAFEVILYIKRNLKRKIEFEGAPSCRLLPTADVLTIVKHAMGLLKSVFQPYSERLKKLSLPQLREVSQRIAGAYHRDTDVNVLTGNGISFTGVTKLYYDCTSLNKVEATKMLCGIGKDNITIYYLNRTFSSRLFFHPSLPGLKEIEAVVSVVMGAPGSKEV